MGKILYYSTNRNLDSGFKDKVTFQEALFKGLASDKGLFMPTDIPKFSDEEILALKKKPYPEIAFAVLNKFLKDDLSESDLRYITKDAYDFPVPIEKVDDYYIARLDRGPTASFKDFAARFMARAMQRLKDKDKDITILVATSGDTGSAVGQAFHGLEGIKVFILYPEKEVSKIQKKQLDSIGDNVQSISVDAKFDDCQKLVKEAFTDDDLKSLNLTSANSISIGRVLPQIVYYFYCYSHVAKDLEKVVFSIPSGNFGNSLGCEIARRMGLPVEKIIIAVNENREFPDFLMSGEYHKIEPSIACLSNAMNVGNPSNLARYFELYSGTVDKEGIVHKMPDITEMRKNLVSYPVTDAETVDTIKEVYDKFKVIVEPHGAVGVCALKKYFKDDDKCKAVVLETADPAKFPEIIIKELGIEPELPENLRKLNKRTGKSLELKNNYDDFKELLLKNVDNKRRV